MTGANSGKGKPPGAWTAQETVLYMVRMPILLFSCASNLYLRSPVPIYDRQLDKVRQGKFYILCPDNETRHEVDQLRIMWGAGDVAEGRPALSRWHRDYKAIFEEYVRDGLAALD